ncbi:MAG TPA: DsbC family protein [Smithellaceae bacterium]|nr:DsbC family protein [Smithellaceae bacterium]
MKKIITIPVLLAVFSSVAAFGASPEEMFKKSFPKKNVESFSETPIKGIYEVYTGNELFYYAPEADLLILGNIVTKDNKSLTRESYFKKMAVKMANLPLEKAVKKGSGKTVIVEFIDPNCHYCKLSYNYLAKRDDVTLYIFFYPLSLESENKIRHILCADNPAAMFDEVMQGKFNDPAKLKICNDKKADETVMEHRKITGNLGIRSTPVFYIKGEVIVGFDVKVFEKVL